MKLSKVRSVSPLSHELATDYGGIYIGSKTRQGNSSYKDKKDSKNLEVDNFPESPLQTQNVKNKRTTESEGYGDQNSIAMIFRAPLEGATLSTKYADNLDLAVYSG